MGGAKLGRILHVKKSLDNLQKIYSENLLAPLISEEIFTCFYEDNAEDIKKKMEELDFDFYGVEKDGIVIGYIKKDELKVGMIYQFVHYFDLGDLVSESTSLIDLLKIMKNTNPIFVLEMNKVKKIITISDLQKQPIRMLVFGLISLLEMFLLDLINQEYKDESWKSHLNDDRLHNAIKLYNIRKEKNEGIGLIDCLQLSDKGRIIKNTPELRKLLNFDSNTKLNQFFDGIEKLRNNTAHSQEYVYQDFNEFLDKITRVQELLSVLEDEQRHFR